jgi:PAS domain S-box-containing protein
MSAGEVQTPVSATLRDMKALYETLHEESERLAQELLRYAELFRNAPEPQLVTDVNGRIREANLAAGDLLGVAPEKLKRRSIVSFVPLEERLAFRTRLNELAAHPGAAPVRWRTLLRTTAGARSLTELAARPLNRNPGICWIIRPS